jgi:Cu-Zn family superoxide dismutase
MKRFATVALALGLLAWAGRSADGQDDSEKGPTKAVAVLHHIGNSKAHGTVYFTVRGEDVEITGTIEGLTPGKHAFHVHEFGDCSDHEKGMSAGGHFNPDKHEHGHQDAEADKRHVGDLGNIEADENGKVELNIKDKVIKLHGPHSIIGRSLIVHEKADEFTQPVGNAGGRVACGVIGVGNAKAPAK